MQVLLDGGLAGRGLRLVDSIDAAAAGSPRSTAGWTMNRAPSGRSRTTAIGAITVSAPRSRSAPETYSGFAPLSNAARSRSAPARGAVRERMGDRELRARPVPHVRDDGLRRGVEPGGVDGGEGTTTTFAPAVRGPSGGGAAAERTPRASATPSTSVGALSNSPHSKRWAESAAGRRPSFNRPPGPRRPPVAMSCPAPTLAIEIDRCSVVAARSANGRGGASSGSPNARPSASTRCAVVS